MTFKEVLKILWRDIPNPNYDQVTGVVRAIIPTFVTWLTLHGFKVIDQGSFSSALTVVVATFIVGLWSFINNHTGEVSGGNKDVNVSSTGAPSMKPTTLKSSWLVGVMASLGLLLQTSTCSSGLNAQQIATACQAACAFLPAASSVAALLAANSTITTVEAAVSIICTAFKTQVASGKLPGLKATGTIDFPIEVPGGGIVIIQGVLK